MKELTMQNGQVVEAERGLELDCTDCPDTTPYEIAGDHVVCTECGTPQDPEHLTSA